MRIKITSCIIFFLIAIMVYVNCYIQEKDAYYINLTKIGQTNNARTIVFTTELNDNEMYEVISEILRRYEGNLYCFNIETINEKEVYTKYVLVNNYEVFDSLKLADGRFYRDDEMQGPAFLSNINTNDINQIGCIASFGEINFQIKTLKNYVDSYDNAFEKTFVLQVRGSQEFESFIEELRQNDIIVTENTTHSNIVNYESYVLVIVSVMVFLLMLIIFYDLINSYKHIGIEKMLGYDFVSIWMKRLIPLLILEVIIYVVTSTVFSYVLFDVWNELIWGFVGRLYVYYIIILLLTVIVISLPFFYVEYISINSIIKNQKPLKAVLRFNYAIKCIITGILLVVLSLAFEQLSLVTAQKKDKYQNWEKMRDYAYIYAMGSDEEYFNPLSEENALKWKQIYIEYNRLGGIMADFSLYSPLYEEERTNASFPEYSEVIVNPNYLKMFPVLDINEEIISISEEEDDYIILVPEKYRGLEREIRLYFEEIKNGSGLSESKVLAQNIKIIWIMDDQKLFSCQLDVGVNDYNRIENAIIHVLTENNGALEEYATVLGSYDCPFKIKVTNGKDSQAEINNVVSKYFDLERTVFPSISVYQSIEEQISMASTSLLVYVMIILLLSFMSLSIVAQNVITYFQQYEKILVVKKFLGYNYLDRYFQYFSKLFISYVIAELFIVFFIRVAFSLVCGVVVLMVDVIFSTMFIFMKDKKNIIRVTKGG